MDELYGLLVVRPYQRLSEFAATVIDRELIDGGIGRWARWIGKAANTLSSLQTGYIRQYVVWFVLGGVLIVGFVLISSSR